MLIEIELQKKHDFLQKWPETQFLLSNLDQELSALSFIRSILLIEPAQSIRLNRSKILMLIIQENLANRHKERIMITDLRRDSNISIEELLLTQCKLID